MIWTRGKNGREKKTQANNGGKIGKKGERKTEERIYGQNRRYYG